MLYFTGYICMAFDRTDLRVIYFILCTEIHKMFTGFHEKQSRIKIKTTI